MFQNERARTNKNDNILRHFILLGLFVLEAFVRIFELIRPEAKKHSESSKESAETEALRVYLLTKNADDLLGVLKEVDVLSTFQKHQLVDLVISNKDALERILSQEKRNKLFKMKNQELRSLLKDPEKALRYRKSELVEQVLYEQKVSLP